MTTQLKVLFGRGWKYIKIKEKGMKWTEMVNELKECDRQWDVCKRGETLAYVIYYDEKVYAYKLWKMLSTA